MSSTGDEQMDVAPDESGSNYSNTSQVELVSLDDPASPPHVEAARSLHSNGKRRADEPQTQDDEQGSAYSRDDSDDDRTNRWQGSDSTWRYHTRDERALAASLDQQQAGDLAIHLYNAHTLKASLYRSDLIASETTARHTIPWNPKRTWMQQGRDGATPWHPHAAWTSWPMRAADVPRSGEVFGAEALDDSGATMKSTEPWYPSKDLEEELLALMLRKAKNQSRQRRFEQPQVSSMFSGRSRSRSHGSSQASRPSSRASVKRSASITVSDADSVDSVDVKPSPKNVRDAAFPVPEFTADDDNAREILQQSVRHIVSKLDALLTGLHESRLGQISTERVTSASVSRSRSQPRSRQPPARKSRPSRSTSRAQRGPRPTSLSPEPDRFVPDIDIDTDDTGSPRPRKRKKGSKPRKRPLGTRDWSEVLGVASLVGWDSTVIDRAAKRCASLFRESMSFRAMPVTDADHVKDEVIKYVPDAVLDFSDASSEADSRGEEDGSNAMQTLRCHHSDCPKHVVGFTHSFRLREHLKRVHGYDNAEVKEIEGNVDASRPRPRTRTPAQPSVSTDGDGGDQEGGHYSSSSEETLFGGVHIDGYLLPVTDEVPNRKDAGKKRAR